MWKRFLDLWNFGFVYQKISTYHNTLLYKLVKIGVELKLPEVRGARICTKVLKAVTDTIHNRFNIINKFYIIPNIHKPPPSSRLIISRQKRAVTKQFWNLVTVYQNMLLQFSEATEGEQNFFKLHMENVTIRNKHRHCFSFSTVKSKRYKFILNQIENISQELISLTKQFNQTKIILSSRLVVIAHNISSAIFIFAEVKIFFLGKWMKVQFFPRFARSQNNKDWKKLLFEKERKDRLFYKKDFSFLI
jgi:hypothetical protein